MYEQGLIAIISFAAGAVSAILVLSWISEKRRNK